MIPFTRGARRIHAPCDEGCKPRLQQHLVQARGELRHAPRHVAPILARGHDEHPPYHGRKPRPLQAPRLVCTFLRDYLNTRQQQIYGLVGVPRSDFWIGCASTSFSALGVGCGVAVSESGSSRERKIQQPATNANSSPLPLQRPPLRRNAHSHPDPTRRREKLLRNPGHDCLCNVLLNSVGLPKSRTRCSRSLN